MDLAALESEAVVQFARHGLVGWSFGFTTAKRQLGVCKYRPKRIEISAYYAQNNPVEDVRDTLLHEIAHALAGPKAGHGPVWQAIALRIGATPQACDSSPGTVVEPGDWQAPCPSCRKTHHRYRRPRILTGYHCRCPARTPLVFAFAGDPAVAPRELEAIKSAPIWRAICPGCSLIHRRQRRPKPGRWLCRCPQRGELKWEYGQEVAESG